MTDGSKKRLKANEKSVPGSELKEAQKRIRELKRILGKKVVELEILEETVKIARKKVNLRRRLFEQGRWSMKAIAERLGISRSSLDYQSKAGNSDKSGPSQKDEALLIRIRRVIKNRLTYGYRRVTTNLNRYKNKPRVNHKRFFRIMRASNLVLPKFTGRVHRAHTGIIMTLKSNIRWCSDGFEIRCWNGENLYVAFSMDCCDREVIGWVASTQHLNSESIRDLVAMSIESRFDALEAFQPIECLTDNGGMYTAHETRAFAASCKLKPRRTPSYSPESNGRAESFVKTFKRDHAYVQDLWKAKAVLSMLPRWFDEYNKNHPHKALKMMSPQQFRCAHAS